jgi:hypothetical protein
MVFVYVDKENGFAESTMTPLDRAFADVNDADETTLLQAYKVLADQLLLVPLAPDSTAENLVPKIFDLAEGKVILAFDTEDRISEFGAGFSEGAIDYAALPGRVLARQLLGAQVSIGLNFGSGAQSEILLPPGVIDWLTNVLDVTPQAAFDLPLSFSKPGRLPAGLMVGLTALFDRLAGNVGAALLAAVQYQSGRHGHLLVVIDAKETAQEPIAGAVSEALIFSGVEMGEIDVTFVTAKDPIVSLLLEHAYVFEPARTIADVQSPAQTVTSPPGLDPAHPPRLR